SHCFSKLIKHDMNSLLDFTSSLGVDSIRLLGFTLTVPEDDASESNSLVTEFLNDSLPDVVVVFSDPSTLVFGGDVCDGEVMVFAEGASSVIVVVEGESGAISGVRGAATLTNCG
nr:hypothetical protein [Tanacetum cinerariifolium]